MIPGRLRNEAKRDTVVGRHQPPSSPSVEAFMHYFESRYRFEELGRAGRIAAIAAAHHRLNYIHPFPDGNGRVSRLMSHAMGHAAGFGAHGLWSISRGLARGLESPTEYMHIMDATDAPRPSDVDGRGISRVGHSSTSRSRFCACASTRFASCASSSSSNRSNGACASTFYATSNSDPGGRITRSRRRARRVRAR